MLDTLMLKLLAAALAVAALGGSALYIKSLRADLALSESRREVLAEASKMQQQAYQHLQRHKLQVDAQLTEREGWRAELMKARRGFDDATRTLLSTNQAVRQWAATAVPGAVADRLRERAARSHHAHGTGGAAGAADGQHAGAAVPGRRADQP
jgi:hypothetical protein